jgi:hypothetical protein
VAESLHALEACREEEDCPPAKKRKGKAERKRERAQRAAAGAEDGDLEDGEVA